MPAMMAFGQQEMFLLPRTILEFPEEVEVRLAPSAMSFGVSQGSGRSPFAASSVTLVRRRSSHGA